MRPSHIISSLKTLLSIRRPVFLWGAPGVGKSEVVAGVARSLGYELRDIRAVLLDPVDLRGIPRITAAGETEWCPPSFLPDARSGQKGILFLDELNAAPPLVQAACYQLILDGRIGEYVLPEGWVVVAAGNREKDRAVTHRMPSALSNRMVHLEFDVSLDDWLEWAAQAGIRPEVTAFLRFRPALLHDFDPQSSARAFASPRSWSFVSDILKAGPERAVEYDLVRGAVGDGAAAEFMGFLAVWRELPSVEEVLSAPETAKVPGEPAALYAVSEALASFLSRENLARVLAYLERLPVEFGVLCLRRGVCRDQGLVESPAFASWAQKHADVLL
ncbi:AAA family ATPase [Mailhella massiliensis]|uniref:MoxR family ATPase n=1 Tax=Mailhella massiliensis TaxID=1903261 RepID=A0A921AXK2_9BACT|nr:MoxR family ATPase [Mailhella massiliensis]HJD97944.1 MoxR family ATPase [Mailhella massiliensis]